MDPALASDPIRPRLAVLWTALVAGFAVLFSEYFISPPEFHSPYRVAAVLITVALAAFELVGGKRTEVLLAGLASIYAALSMVELKTGKVASFFDSGTTLALLILLGTLFAATRNDRNPAPVALFSLGTGAYTIVSLSLEDFALPHLVGRFLLGVVGQIIVMWVTFRLINRLAAAATRDTKSLAIQRALARCSHLLLTRRNDRAMEDALAALLDATEADYAYIDVNRTEADGRVTWQIVHDAESSNVPDGPSAFGSGNYDDIPWVPVELAAGRPIIIRVSELATPIRTRYEAEGIRSELAAPIMIDGKWVGTIGFSDFWREGTWTDIETEALVRAADMIAAAWERDRAHEGLEELATSKDRFIAAVSHELRTPLSAVVGFAAALRDSAGSFSTEEISEMAGVIAAQSGEVADLVEDLLTAERAASGNLTIRLALTDLEAELRAVVGLLLTPPPVRTSGTAFVLADGLRTRQIIRNLLTNASRYGGGDVRIEIGVNDTTGHLTVLDNGTGVLGIDEDRIFDPYYRSRSDIALPDSVGLGLAVARQLARLMGGDLVYRRQDGWTRFELTLPLHPMSVGCAPTPTPDLVWENEDQALEVVPVTV